MTRLLTTTALAAFATIALPLSAAHAQSDPNPSDCILAFGVVDSDGNGKISSEETKKAVDVDFARIDEDGDGKITSAEWSNCNSPEAVQSAMEGASRSETSEAPKTTGSADNTTIGEWTDEEFMAADKDKSGDLSAEEAAARSQDRSGAPADQDAEKIARYQGTTFSGLDANNDGRLSQDEWSNRKEGFNVEASFGRVDANGDNAVSLQELSDYRTGQYDKAKQASSDQEPTIWLYYYYVM